MMAGNRNLLSSRTVHALQFITADTRQAFVSPALVDRMSAMLNYVFQQLVGERSKKLKVLSVSSKSVVSIGESTYSHEYNMCICTLLPRNQSFYRQITGQEKDGAVSGVGQW